MTRRLANNASTKAAVRDTIEADNALSHALPGFELAGLII